MEDLEVAKGRVVGEFKVSPKANSLSDSSIVRKKSRVELGSKNSEKSKDVVPVLCEFFKSEWESERCSVDSSVPCEEPLPSILNFLDRVLLGSGDSERSEFRDLDVVIGGGVQALEDAVEVDSETA